MADYIDLYNLYSGSSDTDELRNRVFAAVGISAEALLINSSVAEDTAWANAVISNQASEGLKMFQLIVSKNADVPIETIASVSDAVLQVQVDSEVPSLVKAFNV